MSDGLERTIETRIGDSTAFPVLEMLLGFFAGLRHRLFRDLIIQEQPKNLLKSSYIRDFQITARQFNSLAFEVSGLAESIQSLNLERRKAVAGRIQSIEKQIIKLQKKLKEAHSRLAQISRYREKVKAWKSSDGKRKKPAQPATIRGVFIQKIRQDIQRNLFVLH